MSSIRGEKSGGGIIFWTFVIFALVVAWFMAPSFLPMYRWLDMDWQAAADAHAEVTLDQIKQPVDVQLRYAPRANMVDDPMPWQVIVTDGAPANWPEYRDAYEMLVRIHLVSDRDGDAMAKLFTTGSTAQDRYFKAQGWALLPQNPRKHQ